MQAMLVAFAAEPLLHTNRSEPGMCFAFEFLHANK